MEIAENGVGYEHQYFVSFTGRDKYNNLQSIWRFFNSNKPVDDNTKLAFFIKDICSYFDLDFETVVVLAFNEVHTKEE